MESNAQFRDPCIRRWDGWKAWHYGRSNNLYSAPSEPFDVSEGEKHWRTRGGEKKRERKGEKVREVKGGGGGDWEA